MADSSPLRRPRRQDIELLRILCTFGIVWFHAGPGASAVAYSGLVGFLVLSVYLGAPGSATDADLRAPARVSQWATVRRRATRLLLPWFVWFFVYGAVNVAQGADFLPARPGIVSAVMAGTSIHLWYLPFMFLTLCGIAVLMAHVDAKAIALLSAVVTLGLVAAAPVWRPVTLSLSYPALQWSDAAAPVAMGLFLHTAPSLRRGVRVACTAAILACAAAVAPYNDIGVAYAIGFAACAVIASGRIAAWIKFNLEPLSGLTFGIYLSHILVFVVLLTHSTVPADWLPSAIFASAAVLVALLRGLFPALKSGWS